MTDRSSKAFLLNMIYVGRNNQDLEPDMIGDHDDIICNPILLSKQGNMMAEVLQLQKGMKRKSVNLTAHPLQRTKVPRRFSYPEGMKLGDNPGEIQPGGKLLSQFRCRQRKKYVLSPKI